MKIEILNGKRLVSNENVNTLSLEAKHAELKSEKAKTSGQWVDFKRIEVTEGVITGIDSESFQSERMQSETKEPFDADITLDAQNCFVFPGLIDLNVSLREPGYTAKGTIATETKAAASGGVTTLCCSPETHPINDSEAVSKLIEELAEESNYCKVLPLGALTKSLKGEQLAEYALLKGAHCVALSNGFHPIKNLAITKRCFEYAATHKLSVFIHPIEPSLHEGVMHEGHVSTTIGLQGIPSLAETTAVAQLIQLAKSTGVHLHLSQLSAEESVSQVKAAKLVGINVTADVAIQNLIFTDQRVENFNSAYHCLPPLRSESDRLALIEGLKSGVIDAVTSAHQPHEAAAKQMPFAQTQAGMSSVEFILPLAMALENKINEPYHISFIDFITAMTQAPANILNMKSPQIVCGNEANICIFDPTIKRVLHAENILSRGKNTPLVRQTLTGQVKATIFEGNISYQSQTYSN